MKKTEGLAGVVLVFIDEKGHAIAHAADFDRSGYGGYTLADSQSVRARRQLAINVVNAYASTQLARAVDAYDAERMVQRLCQTHGCKIQEVIIGGDDKP